MHEVRDAAKDLQHIVSRHVNFDAAVALGHGKLFHNASRVLARLQHADKNISNSVADIKDAHKAIHSSHVVQGSDDPAYEYDKLTPGMKDALEATARDLGVTLTVEDGFRTLQDQTDRYNENAGTGIPAAVPGTSVHETGNAVDVYVNGEGLRSYPGGTAAAARHGLTPTVASEDWHFEYQGGAS
jgi:LAS superfamily LD-carboxypeptidase LdcB